MRFIIILFLFFCLAIGTHSQAITGYQYPPTIQLTRADSVLSEKLPRLELPNHLRSVVLPPVVDNSTLNFLRPVFEQVGASCGQAASVGYNFTYEMAHARNVPADTTINQYPTHFPFNFLSEWGWWGVSYLHTFEILRKCGIPNVYDFGGTYYDDNIRWITGYEKYYNGMHNRLDQAYVIKTDTEEGILTLKHWIYNHLGESFKGGVASFYSNPPWTSVLIPNGSPEAGKHVVTGFYPTATHAMTIVGYNDSIQWDYNEDGLFTNDIDLNGDQVIDVRDWEKGAFKVVNSYGLNDNDSGFYYLMYKVLATDLSLGGIWNYSTHVLRVNKDYEPQLTLKARLEHNKRGKIRVRAGVSSDTVDQYPAHILEFPIYNFQGGDNYMQGRDTSELLKQIEFGLDITPLLSFINTGDPAKYFILVDERDPDNIGFGDLMFASVIDYSTGIKEYPLLETSIPLTENGLTLASEVITIEQPHLSIITENLPPFLPGEPYSVALEAANGFPPYKWEIKQSYRINAANDEFPLIDQHKLIPNVDDDTIFAIPLQFTFPFFGKEYDTVFVTPHGYLLLADEALPWPYFYGEDLLLRTFPVIAPLVKHDLRFAQSDEGVWTEEEPGKITFRWKKTGIVNGSEETFDLALCLHASGNIQFFYNDFPVHPDHYPLAGISIGDDLNYHTLDRDLLAHPSVNLIPAEFPTGFTISPDGILSGFPTDAEQIYDLTVTVKDDRYIRNFKTFSLTSGLMIDLQAGSGTNNLVNYGDTVACTLELKNITPTNINYITLRISSGDEYITLLKDSTSCKTLPANGTVVLDSAIILKISEEVPDLHEIILDLEITSDAQAWHKELFLTAQAPDLKLVDFELTGHNNTILEPGEEAELRVILANEGHSDAYGVEAFLVSRDGTILIEPVALQKADTLSKAGKVEFLFQVEAPKDQPLGKHCWIDATLHAAMIADRQDSILLRVGKVPALVVDLDPNSYSAPGLFETIQRLGVISEYIGDIPKDIRNYQAIFLCLGINFSNHILTEKEAAVLIDYLEDGGRIYMEGRTTWTTDPQTLLHPMFSVTTILTTEPSDTLVGSPGTFTEGYRYLNKSIHPFSFYWFTPVPPAFTILEQNISGRSCVVAHDAGTYKTIAAIFEFGKMMEIEGDSTLEGLMWKYLEFFDVKLLPTGFEGLWENKKGGEYENLVIWPNPANKQIQVRLDAWAHGPSTNDLTFAIYDIYGRMVYSSIPAVLPSSILTIDITGWQPGMYIAILRNQNQVLSTGKFVRTQ